MSENDNRCAFARKNYGLGDCGERDSGGKSGALRPREVFVWQKNALKT